MSDPKSRNQIMEEETSVEQIKQSYWLHEMNDVAKYVDEVKIIKQGN